MQNSYDSQKIDYAGFWVRLAAYVMDSLIVFGGLAILRLVLGIVSLIIGGTVFSENILFHYTLKDILLYVLRVLYFVLCTYYTGTTLGKRALNIRVVSADGEDRLSLLNVIYRETIGRFLCGMTIGIGYIMAGIDQEKRGLHDMLCDTRVVYLKKIKVKTVCQPTEGTVFPPQSPTGEAQADTQPVSERTPSDIQPSREQEEPPTLGWPVSEPCKGEGQIPSTVYRLTEELPKEEFPKEEQQERNS